MKLRALETVLIVALASAGLTYTLTRNDARTPVAMKDSGEAGGGGAKSGGVKIAGLRTATAVAAEGWDVLAVTGKVSVPADRLVKISPRIEGKIVAAHGTVGDTVRPGQVLAVISSVELAEARAQYQHANARLAAARKNHDREQRIAGLGGISVRPLEEAKSEVLTFQGELADAKSELAQARSDLVRQESESAQCKSRLDRAKELHADAIVSKQDLESAEAEFKSDSASVEASRSRISQAESRIDKARSKAEIANQYLSREEKVYKGRMLDTRALHTVKADLTTAKIEAQSAANRIRVLGADPNGSGDTLSIVSPIAGRIVSRQVNVGEMAEPSSILFTVADLSSVWVEADVYEKNLASVHRGQIAEIRVDAYPDRIFSGKVESIGDILSPESRTAKIRCSVANSHGLLKGEMFANVSLITARRGSTVLIPKEAVLDDGGKKIVFTPCAECPEDKKAGTNACGAYDKFEVKTGPLHGSRAEIISGIDPGTVVVTTGNYQLKTAMGSGQLEAGCSGH